MIASTPAVSRASRCKSSDRDRPPDASPQPRSPRIPAGRNVEALRPRSEAPERAALALDVELGGGAGIRRSPASASTAVGRPRSASRTWAGRGADDRGGNGCGRPTDRRWGRRVLGGRRRVRQMGRWGAAAVPHRFTGATRRSVAPGGFAGRRPYAVPVSVSS